MEWQLDGTGLPRTRLWDSAVWRETEPCSWKGLEMAPPMVHTRSSFLPPRHTYGTATPLGQGEF